MKAGHIRFLHCAWTLQHVSMDAFKGATHARTQLARQLTRHLPAETLKDRTPLRNPSGRSVRFSATTRLSPWKYGSLYTTARWPLGTPIDETDAEGANGYSPGPAEKFLLWYLHQLKRMSRNVSAIPILHVYC